MGFHCFVYRSGMITNSKVNQMQMYTVSYHLLSKVAIAEPKQSMDHPRFFRDCW